MQRKWNFLKYNPGETVPQIQPRLTHCMTSVFKMAENFEGPAQNELVLSRSSPCQLLKWKVSANQKVSKGSILAVYKKIAVENSKESGIVVLPKLKSEFGGSVKRLLVREGERVKPGSVNISTHCFVPS